MSTEDLKNDLRAAEQRQRDLAQEAIDLPEKIREASRRAVRERADSARAGGAVLAVASESEISELQDRQEQLPFEIWAQRIVVAELHRDLHEAELQDAEAESHWASTAFADAQREAEEAEKRRGEAYARSSSAGARVDRLRRQIKESRKIVAEIENNYPGA